jgi:hypothetical protein
VLEAGEEAPMSATALVGEMQVLVPMAGLIDKDAELARLDKEIAPSPATTASTSSCSPPSCGASPASR